MGKKKKIKKWEEEREKMKRKKNNNNKKKKKKNRLLTLSGPGDRGEPQQRRLLLCFGSFTAERSRNACLLKPGSQVVFSSSSSIPFSFFFSPFPHIYVDVYSVPYIFI